MKHFLLVLFSLSLSYQSSAAIVLSFNPKSNVPDIVEHYSDKIAYVFQIIADERLNIRHSSYNSISWFKAPEYCFVLNNIKAEADFLQRLKNDKKLNGMLIEKFDHCKFMYPN